MVRRQTTTRVALAAAMAAAVGGCGGGSPAPGAESGLYAGRGGGLGAVVDYRTVDPVATRLREAVKDRGLRVAVAYVVNHAKQPAIVPTFVAERFDGRLSLMTPAYRDAALRTMGLPQVRSIGGDGAATIYLLTRERSEGITRITLRRGNGREVTLTPQSVG